jgi:flagellar assembly factor FliW
MNIDNPHAGSLGATPDHTIEFPEGLAGFETFHHFNLFHPETAAGVAPRYFILQSVDDPAIAFNIADPELFGFSYEINLADAEVAALDLADPAEAAVVVILVKDSLPDGAAPLRANLKAPLIINLRTRRGIQHVFSSLNYQVTIRSPE